jgi:nitrite reductase/ring-hydroxylating ferredoxin subunit
VRVGAVGDFADGTMTPVVVDGQAFVIARNGDTFHAFPDRCTHAKRTLSDGEWDGSKVTCIYHGATFDLTQNGKATMPALVALKCHAVVREGDDLLVDFPA